MQRELRKRAVDNVHSFVGSHMQFRFYNVQLVTFSLSLLRTFCDNFDGIDADWPTAVATSTEHLVTTR